MKKIAVVTANTGKFEKDMEKSVQDIDYDFYNFNDKVFGQRDRSMTPRLQARIPKMFAWQMVPDYDYYIWIDSSLSFTDKNSIEWFLEKCKGFEMAFFSHPNRKTVQQEYDFVVKKLEEGNNYLTPRYKNEFLSEQMEEIKKDKEFVDDFLIASSAFIYKNTKKNQEMLKEWWYHTSRYTTLEQLSLPYVLKKYNIKFNIIEEHYMRNEGTTYVRTKK